MLQSRIVMFKRLPYLVILFLILSINSAQAINKISARGYLVTYFVDNFDHDAKHEDHSYMVHKLRLPDGTMRRLYFQETPQDLSKLDEIEVEGEGDGSAIHVKSYKRKNSPKLSLKGSAFTDEALGNQATLVAIVRDSNRSSSAYSFSQTQLQDIYFSTTNKLSLTSYFQEVSNNRISFSGIVVDTISIPNLCAGGNIFAQDGEIKALNALLSKNYDITQYKRISLIVPDDDGCLPEGIAGIGTVGNFTLGFTDGTTHRLSMNIIKSLQPINTQDHIASAVIAHEFGHNLGLPHDNANVCGERIFSEACPSLEYGGVHSIMGLSYNLAHPNAIHLADLGWLNNSESLTLSSSNIDQEFTISALSADNNDLKTIKIPRGDGAYYSVEYRRPIRSDGEKLYPTLPLFFDGILIYLNDETRFNNSVLFDSTMQDLSRGLSLNSAGTYSDTDLVLDFNESAPFSTEFYDDVNDIRITPTQLGETSASFRISKGSVTNNVDLTNGWTISTTDDQYTYRVTSFTLLKDGKELEANLANQIEQVKWDFDDDGIIDFIYGSASSSSAFLYNQAGTYQCTATIYFKGGGHTTISENLTIVDLINLRVQTPGNSTASETAEIQLAYNKPSNLTLSIQNNQDDQLKLEGFFVVNYNLRKLIKFKSKELTINGHSSGNISMVIAPEKLLRRKLAVDADGYYNITLQIRYPANSSYQYLYPVIRIKAR